MENAWINKDFRLVDKRDDLGRALGWFRGETKTVPVVCDGKKAFGIVDGRKVLARGIRRTTKVAKVAQPTPAIMQDADAAAILEAFDETLAPYLPVCDKTGRCVGAIMAETALDLREARLEATQAVAYAPRIAADATVDAAIQAFNKENVALLPVVENDGYVAGIVRRADLIRLAELDATRIGREDVSGGQTDLRRQAIEGIMEGGWSEIRADAGYEAIRAMIQREGTVILSEGAKYAGLADGAHLIRAINAEVKEEPLYGTATPHYRRV